MAEDEQATVRTLASYREQVGLLVRQHRGRLVDFTGDNRGDEVPMMTLPAYDPYRADRALPPCSGA